MRIGLSECNSNVVHQNVRHHRTRAQHGFLAQTLVTILLAGCGGGTSSGPVFVCTGPRTAISVRVNDAQTGQSVAAGTTVIASLGATYADTVRTPDVAADSARVNVANRPGTYTVTIRKTAYAEWSQSGVVVPSNLSPCEAEPVTTTLNAALTKAP